MGKEKPGFLTAKAISNKIKSKGLQKLRWFCQMCQKQCRDENGFKCHINSESHHRQMLLFDENSSHFLGNNTRIFMKGFLDILRRQFGGKRSAANVVYQEYIKNKQHVHMNSTKFTTLTGFINCLDKMGICRVDQTEKGWFIEYIDKDPEQEHLDRKKRRLDRTLNEDEERFFNEIERNLAKKRKIEKEGDEKEEKEEETPQQIEWQQTDDKIAFNFLKTDSKLPVKTNEKSVKSMENSQMIQSTSELKPAEPILSIPIKSEAKSRQHESKEDKPRDISFDKHKKLSTLEQMRVEQEREKDRKNRTRWWLHEGIVVKLVDSSLPKSLQNQKVVIKQVENRFGAIVKTVDLVDGTHKKMRVQQEHVITVVPKIGEKVLIVNGAYRNCKGILLNIDRKKFSGDIKLVSGVHSGMKLSDINYDDFSKLFDQN